MNPCVSVIYVLSLEGQRAAALLGLAARRVQCLNIWADDPHFAELLALARPTQAGGFLLTIGGTPSIAGSLNVESFSGFAVSFDVNRTVPPVPAFDAPIRTSAEVLQALALDQKVVAEDQERRDEGRRQHAQREEERRQRQAAEEQARQVELRAQLEARLAEVLPRAWEEYLNATLDLIDLGGAPAEILGQDYRATCPDPKTDLHGATNVANGVLFSALAESAEKLRTARAKREYAAERLVWVAAHGSQYLQTATSQGLLASCDATYRQERLDTERPDWEYGDHKGVEITGSPLDLPVPRIPEAALDLLVRARAVEPESRLVYLSEPDAFVVGGVPFLGQLIWVNKFIQATSPE